jgi:hypothetical protein
LRNRPFLLVVAGLFLIALVDAQYMSTLPLQVVSQGLGTSVYAVLIGLNGLMVICVEPLLTGRLQAWPPRRAIPVSVLLVGVGVAGFGLPGGLPVLVAAIVLWTVGEMIGGPPAGSYPALVAPVALRPRFIAAAAGAQGAGYALGPVLGTAVYTWTPSGLWLGCLLVGVLATAVCRIGSQAAPATPSGTATVVVTIARGRHRANSGPGMISVEALLARDVHRHDRDHLGGRAMPVTRHTISLDDTDISNAVDFAKMYADP